MGKFNVDLTSLKSYCYPDSAVGGPLTTSAVAWTWKGVGNYVELIAANAITSDYYIMGIQIAVGDAAQSYQVRLATGAGGVESNIIQVGIAYPGANIPLHHSIVIDPIKVTANTRLSFDATDSEAAGNTIAVYVHVKY